MFSRPSASSASSSRGKRAAPFSSPWVSEASTKPPLRPLAPQPAASASSSTTSRCGRSCLAWTAAHRPVKPPPTIARSASTAPSSGGASAGHGRSSQNGRGEASRIGAAAYAAAVATAASQFEIATLVFGFLIIAGALLAGIAHRSFLSMVAVFVIAGFVLGDGVLGVLEFDAESGFVEQLATVALIVILFRDGLEVESEMLQRAWRLPVRKLVLAMPITCALVALVAPRAHRPVVDGVVPARRAALADRSGAVVERRHQPARAAARAP